LSERNRPAISRAPVTNWTDPLASLSFDQDEAVTPEFIMPFANGRVTSLFNQGRRHPAIDLAGKLGSPVFATTALQRVVFAARRGGYGNAVITRDPQGRTHLYGHLKKIVSKVGQLLDQGEMLGHLGSTGRSTGPHVHYEVRDVNSGCGQWPCDRCRQRSSLGLTGVRAHLFHGGWNSCSDGWSLGRRLSAGPGTH
jgi:murein DD-endopeptidase MepM/ murein hydrolase activator NlpD